MIEFIGWLGGTLLAACVLPQTLKVYRDQKVEGLSFTMLMFWYVGEICMLIYVFQTSVVLDVLPLILNYGINTLCLTYITYMYFKRPLP